MHEHAAPAEDTASAPFLASFGFALGIVSVILAATVKLSPLAFMIALVGIVICALGFVQGTVQSRPVKVALAGIFCTLITIIFWLLAREDINVMVGGRDAWPSWIY
jgi:uncharacterized membrane protein